MGLHDRVSQLSEAGDRYYKAVQEAVGGDLQAPGLRYYPVMVETAAYEREPADCSQYALACFDARYPVASGEVYVGEVATVGIGEFPPLISEGLTVLLVIERTRR